MPVIATPRAAPWPRRRFIGALVASGLAGLPSARAFAQSRAAGAPLRAVVISDLNESYGSTRYSPHVDEAVRRIVRMRPDLVLCTGDMVAGQRLSPPLQRAGIEAMWSAFHAAVSEPLARAGVPLAVTPGNHDASSGSRFELERAVFREQWNARRPSLDFVDGDGYPFSYAFRAGSVLFVSLDVTYIGHVDARAKQWLAGVLQRHGEAASHRVVFSHLPVWPFAAGREHDFSGDEELERILQAGRVEVHLSGHHHAYFPGEKDGVRFVSQSCLGAAPRPLLGTARPSERAVTVMEFPAEGRIGIEAYRAPDFDQPIPRASLPTRVVSKRAVVWRDDLGAAERAAAR